MRPEPAARTATPLARELAARIGREGPIGVEDYMQACLHDPAHGYYRTRGAIGRDGDFITAPEISQMFGELVGLWCAAVWQQMGSPAEVRLIELGPGRGTLMRDALRVARVVAPFHEALRVALVETNPHLIEAQRATLAGEETPIVWLAEIQSCRGDGAAIVIANEFLDTLPVRQWVRRDGRWHDRRVGLDGASALSFVAGETASKEPPPASLAGPLPDGQVFESRQAPFAALAEQLSGLGERTAALLIDYGHVKPAPGDTLQAVRAHRYDDPLAAPGEADLTAQVDFSSLAAAMTRRGLACDGPLTQAEFLGALGLPERASRLMAANPDKAAAIETAAARLMAPVGMGTRFHALGVRSPSLPPLPALARVDSAARPA